LHEAIFHDTSRPSPTGLLHKPCFSHEITPLHMPKIVYYSRTARRRLNLIEGIFGAVFVTYDSWSNIII